MTDLRDPAIIREDIQETREQLGEAVEALAAKADVKGRAHEKLNDARRFAASLPQKAREHPKATGAAALALALMLLLRARD
jgi:phage shock protein A